MSILVDTHILLWAVHEPARLSPDTQKLLDDPGTEVWFSVVNIWEAVIKHALRPPDFGIDPRRLRRGLLEHDWRELAVSGEHALAVGDLPPLHKDPFDRMLLAQAKVEGLTLITSDDLLAQYPGRVRKV